VTGLIFVGMLPPNSHNPEERRFVEELATHLGCVHYLRSIGIKRLRAEHLASVVSRLRTQADVAGDRVVYTRGLVIIPSRSPWAQSLNARWLRWQLRRLVAGRADDWAIWIRFPSPELVDAISPLRFRKVVYEPIDLYSAAEDLSIDDRDRLIRAEERLRQCATVVTGGMGLAERFRGAAGGAHWLPFGCDLRPFSDEAGLPESIGHPRLAVVGELDWRVDEALLDAIAVSRPDWHLVLVGPRREPWGRRLARLANVHWLGRIPSERVPSVIRHCDLTLIPYRLTDWTEACLPVKVFDYLAQGKPVVATPLPELGLLRDVVTVVPPSQFEPAIARALRQTGDEAARRRALAATRFTLQGRAERAAQLLQEKPALARTA
jgi:glycosyltransferase involved in cell wall biosynthesis